MGYTKFAPVQVTMSSIMILAVSVGIISCNYITITMHEILPISVYFLAPSWSIILNLIVNYAALCCSRIIEMVEGMLKRWGNDVWISRKTGAGVNEKKMYFKRIRALRSFTINIGVYPFDMCRVDKEFCCSYNKSVLDYTITVIL